MTTAGWIMLSATWAVVIGCTVRFYVMALRRGDHRDGDGGP